MCAHSEDSSGFPTIFAIDLLVAVVFVCVWGGWGLHAKTIL